MIPEINQEEEVPIKLTHFMPSDGNWIKRKPDLGVYEKIVYLGKCQIDGNLFACYCDDIITIYKGHLNSGKY